MDLTEGSVENVSESSTADVIQPINKETVHRICSGQVVLSVAIAVKELVENAIDANATNIEIRLKEYGSELVEVSDNGTGVRKENFAALTLKHYTSKIRQFSDLEFVSTLGFRGEALSSLCALCDLSIITKHESAEVATKLQYDHSGHIINQTPIARSQGTTVSLANLFSTLPVRRKEFIKNLKREYNKMCQLLYAYCLVSKGIKFTCSNQTAKGSKSTVVATQGLNSVRDNIVGVFGSKQISTLIEIELTEPEEKILQEYSIRRATADPLPFKLECYISSAMHGSGRSATDRQFYYINSRPCEPSKISKLVNEIYRQFNGNQYPFVYMNIMMESNQIDVNVTPDKRQIFMEQEKLLLATIKASLLEAFKVFPSTYKVQNVEVSKQIGENSTSPRGTKRSLSEFAKSPTDSKSFLNSFRKKPKDDNNANSTLKEKSLEHFNFTLIEQPETSENSDFTDGIVCKLVKSTKEVTTDVNEYSFVATQDLKNVENIISHLNTSSASSSQEEESPPKDVMYKIVTDDSNKKSKGVKRVVPMQASMEMVRQALKNTKISENLPDTCLKFRSEITPEGNKTAEQELQKQISKHMFKEMKIIGQFNLGFIIASLNNDLFIIDQHATDEKYNFEQLQLTTTLENQKLVNPKPLQLTSANEELLIENEEIFKKNGFNFKVDHEAEATKKIFLTAIPMSKNYIFGKDDIDEMLFMLQDSSHTMVRPSRVRSMFASRACRKSVMVGKSLSLHEMKRLVDRMGEIEHPWNCPHGRPTMRHLINLSLIQND